MKVLDEIKARAERATPGPWYTYPCGMLAEFVMSNIPGDEPGTNQAVCSMHDELSPQNAEFIAHAREDVPRLVAALYRAMAQRDKALSQIDLDDCMDLHQLAGNEEIEAILNGEGEK